MFYLVNGRHFVERERQDNVLVFKQVHCIFTEALGWNSLAAITVNNN
jgi:hypothetical protein